MDVKLVSVTESVPGFVACDQALGAEALIVYLARVSTPNQSTASAAKLLAYLIKHRHWSPFEMVDMTVEIRTSRAISAQILRHRSFSFQELSQRYTHISDYCLYGGRRQAEKNRQDSIDDLEPESRQWFVEAQRGVRAYAGGLYAEAIDRGIARECARFLLPMGVATRMYMKGSVRSWIHYLQVRTGDGVQREHRDIATAIQGIFCHQFPAIAAALQWGLLESNSKEAP